MNTENRLHYLDNLRTFLIFLVVLVHAGVVYESSGLIGPYWLVDDPATSDLPGLVNLIVDIFAMFTIFFIAGYFAPSSLERKGARGFLKAKFRRLVLPWAIAVLTLIPLYNAIFLYSRGLPQGDWTAYFHFTNRTISMNWLWFLPVLFLFDLLYVGLRKVNLGIESGSDRILSEIYDKRITVTDVRRAVSVLKELDLKIHGYFMLGAPSETRDEIDATIALSRELPLDDAMFSITTPLPATHLYEKTKELVGTEFGEFDYYKHSVYRDASVLSEKELNSLRKRAIFGFYLRPGQVLRVLRQSASPTGMKKLCCKLKRV